MQINVQLATDYDLSDVLLLRNAGYSPKRSMSEWIKILSERGRTCLIARNGLVAVGYVLIYHADERVEILGLGVLPDSRRQGVGRALLEVVKREIWPCELIETKLKPEDTAECSFLEACGFELESIIAGKGEEKDQLLFRSNIPQRHITLETMGSKVRPLTEEVIYDQS